MLKNILYQSDNLKKVNYRNHTKHNMRLFITCLESDIKEFLTNLEDSNNLLYKNTQFKYLFNLLKKNYVQFSLDSSIFDIMCVNRCKSNPFFRIRKEIKLNLNKTIFLTDLEFNIENEQYLKNKLAGLNTESFNIKGGIIYIKNTTSQTSQVIDMISQTVNKNINFLDLFLMIILILIYGIYV